MGLSACTVRTLRKCGSNDLCTIVFTALKMTCAGCLSTSAAALPWKAYRTVKPLENIVIKTAWSLKKWSRSSGKAKISVFIIASRFSAIQSNNRKDCEVNGICFPTSPAQILDENRCGMCRSSSFEWTTVQTAWRAICSERVGSRAKTFEFASFARNRMLEVGRQFT